MNPEILTIVTSTSGIIGLLGLLAYLYYQLQINSAERSIRQVVEGEGIFKSEQVVEILKQFTNDEARLEALKALTGHDEAKASNILAKVKKNVDIESYTKISGGNYRTALLVSGVLLLIIALVGFLYAVLGSKEASANSNASNSNPAPATSISIGSSVTTHGACSPVGMSIQGDFNCNTLPKEQKISNFDSLYQQSLGENSSQYMSSHNMINELVTAMKRELGQNTDASYWQRFGEIWNKNANFLNSYYRNLAICFSRSACLLGSYSERMCNDLRFQVKNLNYIKKNIENTGAPITVNYNGAPPIVPINVVDVPSISNLEILYARACEKKN
ncbi:MAG: hypothetical protein WBO24_14715 [Nitrospirales bacterium]